MKRQNDRILKEKLPRSVGAQYATGDPWRNNSRKNEGMEPKHKQYPALDVTGDRSKVRCCKAKDFDCVDHNKLSKILQEMGIPHHLTCLLRNLYIGQDTHESG